MRKVIIVIDQPDVADQLHPVKAVVIMPADERRNEGRPGLGGEQRLIGREAQRDIDHGAIAGQRLAGLEAVNRQRHLDADIVGDLAQHFGLTHHAGMVERDHFGADRAIGHPADFPRHFHEIAARLHDQRGVGGHAIEQAGGGQFLDVGNFGGVGKEFHRFACFQASGNRMTTLMANPADDGQGQSAWTDCIPAKRAKRLNYWVQKLARRG